MTKLPKISFLIVLKDRNQQLRAIVFLLGVVAPLIIALVYVHLFGVNVPVHDEWNFMPAIESFYSGNDWPKTLIDHYGEHRIPLPKALIIALAPFTKYNVKTEMYVSVLLMLLCVLVCRRLIKQTHAPFWLAVPIGWLLLSTAQYHNLLVGWQLQIPMMNFFTLATVWLLTKEPRDHRHEAAAIACATAATFSFANGLFVWPAAIFLVFQRDRSYRRAGMWIAVALLAVALYLVGYGGFHRTPNDQTPDYLSSIGRAPSAVLGLFLAVAGNNFGNGTLKINIISGILVCLILIVLTIHLLGERKGWSTLR